MSDSKPGQLHPSWLAVIGDELHKPYMGTLRDFLKQEKESLQRVFQVNLIIFARVCALHIVCVMPT